jgi:hypothetical protein
MATPHTPRLRRAFRWSARREPEPPTGSIRPAAIVNHTIRPPPQRTVESQPFQVNSARHRGAGSLTVRRQGNVAIINGMADLHQRNKDKPTAVARLLVLMVWIKGPQGWPR